MLKKKDIIKVTDADHCGYGKICVIIGIGKKPRTKDTIQYEVEDQFNRYYCLENQIEKIDK